MTIPLSLEPFDTASADDQNPDAGFAAGYEAGFAAGCDAANQTAAAVSESLAQTIEAIAFTHAEARFLVQQDLAPLFQVLVEKILPHCVSTGFAGHLVDFLQQVASTDASCPVTLHVHPDQRTAVLAALQDTPSKVTVKADATLDAHAAWIGRGGRETFIDVDGLCAQITAVLGTHSSPEERSENHG